MNKKTIIISAFPACGKTHMFESGYENSVILDSDSSKYSWLDDGVTRNPNFIDDYINHIKSNIGKVDYILVSSHIDVRNALEKNNLCWAYVVPSKGMLNEWVGRCYRRGNKAVFIDLLINNWDDWVNLHSGPMPNASATLKPNEYLSDHMRFIETTTYN